MIVVRENIVTLLTDFGVQDEYVGVMKREVASGKPLLIIGSRGLLEISVNGGSAARILHLGEGDMVEVR